jgi:2-polyprenyl-3-methyl-5-hydroxy-6-metoxy-1,4-benzoquinol methylase
LELPVFKHAKSVVKNALNRYPQRICRQEFESQTFTRFNERPIEFAFVFRKLGEIYPRKVLDVGTGTTALPHLMRNCGFLVTATDNVRDYWPSGMHNRHYHIVDDDITKSRLDDSFDLITCISVLEHIERADDAVGNMFRLLNQNGYLILSFPYNERTYVRNVYDLSGSSYGQGAPYITQSYSRAEVERWVADSNGVIVDQEYWQFWDGDYWTVGNQIIPPRKVTAAEKHQHTCILLQKL